MVNSEWCICRWLNDIRQGFGSAFFWSIVNVEFDAIKRQFDCFLQLSGEKCIENV